MVLYAKALSPAAKFDVIAPAPYEPRSPNAPVMVIAPATVSFVEGLLVPIPMLPEESMRIYSETPPLPNIRLLPALPITGPNPLERVVEGSVKVNKEVFVADVELIIPTMLVADVT